MRRTADRGLAWRVALIVGAICGLTASGCDLLRPSLWANRSVDSSREAPGLPSKYSHRVSQFVFVTDFEIRPDLPLFRELAQLRDEILSELKLPTPPNYALISVYLFPDRDQYERFMQARYPSLPRRRAFFVAQPRGMSSSDDLMVYTFWGEHIRQDLRHELTHALLHSVLKDVPLWLDEGLAEFFELPPESRGLNRLHLAQLKRDGLAPNLSRLELMTQVDQMSPAEYREAWAWVHFMLRGDPRLRPILMNYLQQLRKTANPGSLQTLLKAELPELEEDLLRHLASL
jgi:hypothetical protein